MQVLYKSPETLFTYTQCFFSPPAVGHVSYHSQNPELVSKLHSGGRDLRRSNVPGLCPYQEFFLFYLSAHAQLCQYPLTLLFIDPQSQIRGGFPQHFFLREARHAQETFVDYYISPFWHEADADGVETRPECRREHLRGLLQSSFRSAQVVRNAQLFFVG